MTMPLYRAVQIAKIPGKFSYDEVVAAKAALTDYTAKKPDTAYHYAHDINRLELAVEGGEGAPTATSPIVATATEILPPIPVAIERQTAALHARLGALEIEPTEAPALSPPAPVAKPVTGTGRWQYEGELPMPVSLALYIADHADSFVGFTLADAMEALKAAEAETKGQAFIKGQALIRLSYALGVWQAVHKPPRI